MSNSKRNLGEAFPQSNAPQQAQPGPPRQPSGPQSGAGQLPAERGNQATRRMENTKLAIKETGSALLHSGETLGTLFLASTLEGYVGEDKLELAGVDARIPAGMAMQGYGLYRIFSGEKGGEHLLSIGNGVTGSWLASQGRKAGKALRDRNSSPPQGQVNAGAQGGFRGEGPLVRIPEYDLPEASPQMSFPAWQGMPQPDPYYNPFAGANQPQPLQYAPPPYQYVPYPPQQGWPAPAGLLPPPPGVYDPRVQQPPSPQNAQPNPPANPQPQIAGPTRNVTLSDVSDVPAENYPGALPRLHVSPPQSELEGAFEGRRPRPMGITPGARLRDRKRGPGAPHRATKQGPAPRPRPTAPPPPRRENPDLQPYTPPPPVEEPLPPAETETSFDEFADQGDLMLEENAFEGQEDLDPSDTFPSEDHLLDD